MSEFMERVSVRLAQTSSRRGFLDAFCRVAIGLGATIAGAAIGGPLNPNNCCPMGGIDHTGSCNQNNGGGTGCGGTLCSSRGLNCNGYRPAGCNGTVSWYCCCFGTKYTCQDCINGNCGSLCVCANPGPPCSC